MGNILKSLNPRYEDYLATDDNPNGAMTQEAPTLHHSWMKDSEVPMMLQIMKAEAPAFFQEGYLVDIDETEDYFYKALMQNDASEVRNVIRREKRDVNSPLKCVPYTPLQVICMNEEDSSIEILQLLKDNGANLNLQRNGYSPLVSASRYGHTAIVTFLLENGAYVDQKSDKEHIPRFLLDPFNFAAATCSETSKNKKEVTSALKRLGTEHIEPYWGNTALMQAAREQHEDIVDALIGRKCKSNLQNTAGNTALHIACLSRSANGRCLPSSMGVPSTIITGGSPCIVRKLLEAGAEPNLKNHNGETSLERVFRVIKPNDPLSMYDWACDEKDQIFILRNTCKVIKELLMGGSTLRSTNYNPECAVDYLVTCLTELGGKIKDIDKENSLEYLFHDVLLLFYECVYISEERFAWDDLEYVIITNELPESFNDKLLKMVYRDFSLVKLSRAIIRRNLKCPTRYNTRTLPVPKEIQDFILFSDYDY